MSNRRFNQFQLALEKGQANIFARVTFGATGAPTLVASQSKGIKSVTRNSAGLYTFVFGNSAATINPLDTYVALLNITHIFDASANSGTAPAAPQMYLVANNITSTSLASIQIQFANAGSATDPANLEAVDLCFSLRNSTAY